VVGLRSYAVVRRRRRHVSSQCDSYSTHDIRYKLTRFAGRAPTSRKLEPCPKSIQALAGVYSDRPRVLPITKLNRSRSAPAFVSQRAHSHLTRFLTVVSRAHPLLPFVLSPTSCYRSESSPAEATPLTSALATPGLVFESSCFVTAAVVSGLDEGVIRKRLLLLFLQTCAAICHGIPATGRSG